MLAYVAWLLLQLSVLAAPAKPIIYGVLTFGIV
jgi:hypothetical protein